MRITNKSVCNEKTITIKQVKTTKINELLFAKNIPYFLIRLFIVTWIIWVKRFVKYLNKRSWSLTMHILFFFLCFYALWQFKYFSDARKTVRLTCHLFLIAFVINVFRLTLPVPCISKSCIEIKIKLNFYFHTSFWYLKRFYEGL